MAQGGQITRIEVQKRHPQRRSIFIDGAFRFGLDEEIVLKHGLKVGQLLEEGQIAALLSKEEFKKGRNDALNLLSYHDRSSREIRDRLREKGYPADIIEEVVASLTDAGLLDDRRYAIHWGGERLQSRPMGARLLKAELCRKGFSSELIEQTIERLYAEQDERRLAAAALEQHRGRLAGLEPLRARKKAAGYLLRRGFPWEVVRDVLPEFIPETETQADAEQE